MGDNDNADANVLSDSSTLTFTALGTGRKVENGTGIQEWMVPETRKYSMEVWGAAGGSHGKNGKGGRGIKISGDFILTQGDLIKILVGHKGIDQPGTGIGGGGGGGGSFVVNSTRDAPFIIAGGGAGASDANCSNFDRSIADATEKEDGKNSSDGKKGGKQGHGSTDGSDLCHGGGYYSDGKGGGTCFKNGGQGRKGQNNQDGDGGFGGGGGAYYVGGAGGGYSGGAGAGSTVRTSGGGGSFNGGSSPATLGFNEEMGKVIITRLDSTLKSFVKDYIQSFSLI